MKYIIFRGMLGLGAACALLACSPAPESGARIAYPTDAQIASALEAQFSSDPDSAVARDLIRTLGGDKGQLRYQIHQVIYRQGAYEARYDAVLVMGQPGSQSLQALYASMVPEAERAQLAQADLNTYAGWLKQQVQALQTTSPPQAQALASTLELLESCYQDKPAGAEVTVMQGLGALLSPERQGLYVEKLALPGTTAHCLPA